MFKLIFNWLTGGTLDRILTTIDRKVDNETDRERIKGEVVGKYLQAQTEVLTGRGWWFPLLFIVPAGFWFSSVLVYSVLFCQRCIMPQTWTIAALPPPLDDWMAAIVGALFVGSEIRRTLRK